MDDELRTFLAVVSTGSFTAASRQVHRTQPAVTGAIKRLEHWAGAKLLERGASGAVPTAAGLALLPHAQAVVTALRDGRRAVAEVVGLSTGEVRLGANNTACAELLPPHLARFHRDYPGVAVRLREGNNNVLSDALAAGRVDLIIATGGQPLPPRSVVEPWVADQLVLVRAPGCRSLEVLTFTEGSAIRALLKVAWPEVEIGMELGSVQAVRAHAVEGIGMALLSSRSVRSDLKRGRLEVVEREGFPIYRELVLCHRGVERLSVAAAALRDQLLGKRARARVGELAE